MDVIHKKFRKLTFSDLAVGSKGDTHLMHFVDVRRSYVDANWPSRPGAIATEETPEERCSSEDYALDAIFAHLRGEGPCTSVRRDGFAAKAMPPSGCGVIFKFTPERSHRGRYLEHNSPARRPSKLSRSKNIPIAVDDERRDRILAVGTTKSWRSV